MNKRETLSSIFIVVLFIHIRITLFYTLSTVIEWQLFINWYIQIMCIIQYISKYSCTAVQQNNSAVAHMKHAHQI